MDKTTFTCRYSLTERLSMLVIVLTCAAGPCSRFSSMNDKEKQEALSKLMAKWDTFIASFKTSLIFNSSEHDNSIHSTET